MQGTQRLTMVGAAAMLALGTGAASAESSGVKFTLHPLYPVSCDATYTGTNGPPITLTPTFTNCTMMGLPATVTQSAPSQMTFTALSGGWYVGSYTLPASSTTVIAVSGGCTGTITGPQTLTHAASGQTVRARNVTGGAEIELSLNSLAFVASGCPYASGLFGAMTTVTPAFVPGVTVP